MHGRDKKPVENGLKCAQTGSLARFNALFVLDVDFQSTNCKDDCVKNEPRRVFKFSPLSLPTDDHHILATWFFLIEQGQQFR